MDHLGVANLEFPLQAILPGIGVKNNGSSLEKWVFPHQPISFKFLEWL